MDGMFLSQIRRPLHSGLDEQWSGSEHAKKYPCPVSSIHANAEHQSAQHLHLATPALLHTFLPSPLSAPIMPGHARHDTALIHGLSATEVQTLSEACIEAKSKAYCKFDLPKISQQLTGH